MLKNVISLSGFVIAATALVGLVLIDHLFARNIALLAVQVAAGLLMIWARMTFGLRSFHAAASTSEGGLVTTGPYRIWRHPIYASIIYFVWAGQVEAPGALPMALAAAVSLGMLLRMALEEQFLTQTYPEYSAYAQSAKRLIPFIY